MVKSSFPPSRVGAAAIPDSIFITRQMMILLPDADSAVPQSPVSGNAPSARGLTLVGSGTSSTARLGGMFRRISFMPSGSLFPVARAETSPSSTLPTVVVAGRCPSSRNVHPLVHPGGMPWPGTPFVSTPGWLALTRPAATGCEPWSGSRRQITERREG